MEENDENIQDYLVNDFSSSNLGEKFPKIQKKYLIIGAILLFFIIIFAILIIFLITNEKSENKQNIIGQINCIYKNEIHSLEEIKILGDNFEKNSIFEIYIDGKKIKFTKTYKFSNFKEHKIEYHLFEEINMKKMFQNISSLISVEMISNKNCKILSMLGSLENCINLESFKIEGFNVENIKSLEKTFYNTKIKEIDLNIFKNIQIEDISYMFALSPIKNFNFSIFDFSNIKNMFHLFENCSSLEEIVIPSIINLDKLEDMSYMYK